MAGPGIRYYHLSRVLSRHTDLTLAIRPQDEDALTTLQERLPTVTVMAYVRGNWPSIQEAAAAADIIILGPYTAIEFPQLRDLDPFLVVDGYDPVLIEWLTTLSTEPMALQMEQWAHRTTGLFAQYLFSDFIICASQQQRYWWLGQLEVAGRINPRTYRCDPSLRNLVDIVPYGLPQDPAQHTRQAVKGVWPGIGLEDTVLLWGGGLWPWLDPMTAIQAVERLHAQFPQLRLIFPGTVHPNTEVGTNMPVHNTNAHNYAKNARLLNKSVFFGKWTPYEDWANVLLESDIALSLHHETVETQLAFRSRVLEYIWAGVPTITTGGDATSQLILDHHLGEVVAYNDVEGVAAAITKIMEEGPAAYRPGLAAARQMLTWEQAARPLINFCSNPWRAADRTSGPAGRVLYYERQLHRMEKKLADLERLVAGYENGRVMRLLNGLNRLSKRVRSASGP